MENTENNQLSTYEVVVEKCPATGRQISETWQLDGEIHRDHDLPAQTVYMPDTGDVRFMKYFQNGKLHRDGDEPAVYAFDPNKGHLLYVEYFKNGLPHRDNNLPAIVGYNEDGGVKHREFFRNGQPVKNDPHIHI